MKSCYPRLFLGALCLFLGTMSARAASCPALPYTLANGTVADATQVMANFNSTLGCLADKIAITDNTPSTSTTTGALTVVGGMGVGGAIYAGGAIHAISGGLWDGSNEVFSIAGNNGITATGDTLNAVYPRDYIAGLMLSNDSGTPHSVLDIAAGQAVDSTNATYISLGAFTKSTSGSWVAGSGANGMGSGLTIAVSTWYHVFAIVNSGSADVYFDTSPTAANAPAGTTAFRRIGSFETDGSADILAFTQYPGGVFIWASGPTDISLTNLGTTFAAETLNDVPPGVNVEAILQGWCSTTNSGGTNVFIEEGPNPNSTGPTANSAGPTCAALSTSTYGFGRIRVWTQPTGSGGAGQVYAKAAATTTTLKAAVMGWVDPRGRDN